MNKKIRANLALGIAVCTFSFLVAMLSTMPTELSAALNYQERMSLPSCQSTVPGEWFIKAQRDIVDGTQIWTANNTDLVIDIVDGGQFNGCYGSTEVSNGMLTLSLKETGKRRNKTCSAKFEWQFDYEETAMTNAIPAH
jgi:hypothetical protein